MSDTAPPPGGSGATDLVRWGASTHTGQIRNENEDSLLALPLLFVVADGMGGHQAGEVASALAVQTLRDRLSSGASNVDLVIASVVEANAAIFHAAHQNAGQLGMGTTLTALAVMPGARGEATTLALVNVGDSRTYRMRNGVLERVTIDHSYVQELVSTGHITEAEARTHPRRNIVTRALGIEPTVRVDAWTLSLVRGDRFVLCSDGLVDEVPDHEIELVAAGVRDPQAAADELVAMANRHGGRDNVTVVVVDVLAGLDLPPEDDITGATPRPAQRGRGDTAQQPVLTGPVRTGNPDPDTTAPLDAADQPAATTPTVPTPAVTTPTVPTPRLPPRTAPGAPTAVLPAAATGATAIGATATGATATTATTGGAAGAPRAKRRITGGMFLFFLAAALLVTLTITFVAVALRNDDDAPTDTTDTTDTVVTTVVESAPATTPETAPATEPDAGPTTTRPRTTTTVDAPTTTVPGP